MSARENIENAIAAHNAWRTRVADYVRSHECIEPDVVETIGNDHACDFGKWLFGPETRDYRTMPEYDVICRLHAKFHATAASVCCKVNDGDKGGAEAMMTPHGEYPLASNKLLLALNTFHKMF